MEGIFTTFGVDWRLLLIQAINFGILLFGLWYFLYGPIMKTLEARRQKVLQGVHDAEAAETKLKDIEQTRIETLAAAGHEADEILARSRTVGTEKEHELLARGESAAAQMIKDAEAQSKELKQQAIMESKQEVAKLIVLGIEKSMKGERV